MKKLFKITLIIIVLLVYSSATAITCQKSESKILPQTIQKVKPNIYHYNYNIQQVQKDPDGDGQMETFYQYCYVRIEGKITKKKVLEAISKIESSDIVADIEGIEVERTSAKQKLQQISQMTYTQIDAHIENTFGSLSVSQKNSLKMLYKVVLGILKMQDLE